MKRGFTLIELLVVVLIIGVLSSVALPQYQKAVEKSKSVQAITMLKSAYQAAAAYYGASEDGSYPKNFAEMGFEVPWSGTDKWDKQGGVQESRSNGDWSLQLYKANQGHLNLYIGRINGKYKGAGFEIQVVIDGEIQSGVVRCAERKENGVVFEGAAGDYCRKIMGGREVSDPLVQTYRVYALP